MSGPSGSYTYGNSAHLDAATAIGSGYTAAYDAAGNMTCRAPTNTRTCAGTQTGAQLTYDSEGRLSAWQDAPGLHSTATSNLYDGEGHRVAQQVTTGLPSNPSTTAITYVSKVEELSSTAGTTTTTTSYYAAGQRIAQAVNGVFSYLGSDGLGSAQVALDASGNPTASVLYAPYGQARYTSGTMPGSYGYTGQHSDGATGLDYYNARYYDPVAGQFISADTIADGLNRYAYVHGNPETYADPTGHKIALDLNAGDSDVQIVTGVPWRRGAVSANKKRAVVSDPLVVSTSTNDKDPNVYQWGDTESGQGALVYEFQGTQIDTLIDIDKAAEKSCTNQGCFWTVAGLTVVILGLIGAAAGTVVTPGPGTGAGAAAGSALATEIVTWVMNSKLQDLKDAEDALQGARNAGRQVFYASMWFEPRGYDVGYARQEAIGSADFQTSLFDVQWWIGEQMLHACQTSGQIGETLPACQ